MTGWVLNTVLSSLLASIQIHNHQMKCLKDASLVRLYYHTVLCCTLLPHSPVLYSVTTQSCVVLHHSPFYNGFAILFISVWKTSNLSSVAQKSFRLHTYHLHPLALWYPRAVRGGRRQPEYIRLRVSTTPATTLVLDYRMALQLWCVCVSGM